MPVGKLSAKDTSNILRVSPRHQLLWDFRLRDIGKEHVTVRTSSGWRSCEAVEYRLPDGRHAWLWWRPRDASFSRVSGAYGHPQHGHGGPRKDMSADPWCPAASWPFAISLRPTTFQQIPGADQGRGICGAFPDEKVRWSRTLNRQAERATRLLHHASLCVKAADVPQCASAAHPPARPCAP